MATNHMVRIGQPDDWHLHVRDGATLRAVLRYSRWARRAIIMPNSPKIETVAQAIQYRDEIEQVAAQIDMHFTPLMTLYLTENLDINELVDGWKRGIITAVKRYPKGKGATTGADDDAENDTLDGTHHVLETMQKHGIPLLCHPEIVVQRGELVDDYDREQVFMNEIGVTLVREFPKLKVVMEHLSKRSGVEFMEDYGSETVGATITPQHPYFDRRDRYKHGGNAPDLTMRPFLGRKEDKMALRRLIAAQPPYLFLGTDSAPHSEGAKSSSTSCPCGCFNAPNALGMYAEVFEELGVLNYLDAFASKNGPRFYGLEPNAGHLTLVDKPWRAEGLVPYGERPEQAIRPVGYREDPKKNLEVAWQVAA